MIADVALDVARKSPAEIKKLSDRQLLETIWALESIYREENHAHDHRMHFSRRELENVYFLMQRRIQLRTDTAHDVG